MRIAINGAGIAGPALAYWLHRSGHEPTLIEKAPHFRTGGYVVDFWGLGYTVAEKMGILPDVLEAGYSFQELRLVDQHGHKTGGFPTGVFRRLTNERFTSLPRGDLASAIYKSVENRIETQFGNTISGIEECRSGLRVTFQHGPARDFDLVIGADGLHSTVRRLVFGPESQFEKRLGYFVATFEAAGYRPRDELVYIAHVAPGRQFARIAIRDDRTMFLFVFRADHLTRPEPSNLDETRAVLRATFGDMGWESAQILQAMDSANQIYFDRVSQIVMNTWSKGRVLLIGDAASAVSLLAGEGTGLAMTEAYVLAGELNRAQGDFHAAFQSYERQWRPFLETKQASAEKFAASFLPKSGLGIWFRNQVMRIMNVPPIADWVIRRSMSIVDDFHLPDYPL
jgi:2-polyprenyl-6-methoxyphenol hydroxylase-like FAD-dependent oxidoreductase